MRQTLKSYLNVARFGAAVGLASCWVAVLAPLAQAQEKSGDQAFAQEYVREEQRLKEKLSEEALWQDVGRKEELLGYLEAVTIMRARSLAPILVKRIAYDPDPNFADTRIRPLRVIYPAYGALKAIGLPSVTHLLAELRKIAPKDETKEMRLKRALLISCICEIYEQGVSEAIKARPGWQQTEHGNVMVKKRLELELAATKDEKERASLQAALDHPIFKEEAAGADKK